MDRNFFRGGALNSLDRGAMAGSSGRPGCFQMGWPRKARTQGLKSAPSVRESSATFAERKATFQESFFNQRKTGDEK